MVAIAYENKFAEYDRVYQVAKLMMYSPASGMYWCPIAMTDGAVKTLLNCNPLIPEVKNSIQKLMSRYCRKKL